MDEILSTANHICTDVTRKIHVEFPSLTIIPLFHQPDGFEETLKNNAYKIKEHPAGEAALIAIEENGKEYKTLYGLYAGKDRHVIPMLAKPAHLLCLRLEIKDVKDQEELRRQIIAALYPALFKLKTNDTEPIAQHSTEVEGAYLSLLNDSYGALVMELLGYKDCIKKTAKKYAIETLKANSDNQPEYHPYPLAIDALSVIMEELGHDKSKHTPFTAAIDMVDEISETFTQQNVQKWQEYCQKTQELAWSDYKPEDILGTAVHTSEDAFIRAISHIVADTLNISPHLSTRFDTYNPFTENEANQRQHDIMCKTLSKRIMFQVEKGRAFDFQQEIRNQNKNLLHGLPLGWCAFALMETIKIAKRLKEEGVPIDDQTDEITAKIGILRRTMEKSLKSFDWQDVQQLHKFIFSARQDGTLFTGTSLVEALSNSNVPKSHLLKDVFLLHGDEIIYDPEEEKRKAHEKEFGSFSFEDNSAEEESENEDDLSDLIKQAPDQDAQTDT